MDKDKLKAFADKVFGDMAGAMTAGMGYVGVKTGLFRAMAGKGPMRVEDVAREAELHAMSWCYWEFGAGFGVFDRDAGKWREPLEKALLGSNPP